MNRLSLALVALAALAGLVAAPASAAVVASTPQGFEVASTYEAKVPPAKLYAALLEVQRWWNSGHTFSGSASNLSIDAHPGGCFCERLKDGGGVQHMTVVYAAPGQALRLAGALGPLQAEGVAGALTFTIKPSATGATLQVDYVVGGYLRKGSDAWAPVVDQVLGEQAQRLVRYAETASPETK